MARLSIQAASSPGGAAADRLPFRPRTGLPDMDRARFSAEQRFEVLIPQESRFGALIQDNTHLAPARYEVEVPPVAQHVLICNLHRRPVDWQVAICGRTRRVVARADELTFFPAGTDLRFVAQQGRERILHLHLGPSWLQELAAEAGLPAPPGPEPMTELRDPQIALLLRRIGATLRDEPACGALIREHAAVLAAVEMLRLLGLPAVPRRHHIPPARLRAVLALVEERLGEDIALSDLAAAARLSRFHFARAFRAETGATPLGYVLARRVERAKRMMLEQAMPLSEIALACGFAHQAHFTTAFRKVAGTTPGRWRAERLA